MPADPSTDPPPPPAERPSSADRRGPADQPPTTQSPPAGQPPPDTEPPSARSAAGREEFAFAAVEPVRLPDWMRPAESEHRPVGRDRLRFFWARHNGALVVGFGMLLALAMLAVGAWMVVQVADGYRASTTSPRQSPTQSPMPTPTG
ncbi:hypothetical protein [Micromonospora phytophila]|uniref:hypothetical protein n=1 Tax=Micromonospora phytophila TaxID=709888 RepID=UPI0020306EDF|nr:hypothetical protein [Micromonospora phytophila]